MVGKIKQRKIYKDDWDGRWIGEKPESAKEELREKDQSRGETRRPFVWVFKNWFLVFKI